MLRSIFHRKFLFLSGFFVVGLLNANPINAEEVYVKDSLRVGVREEPGKNIGPAAVVVTGMKLQILESSGKYIRIRNKSGIEGWIKRIYVSSEPPAVIHLQQLQEKHQSLKTRLSQQTTMIESAKLDAQGLADEINSLKKDKAELTERLNDERSANTGTRYKYLWKFLLILIIAVAGFTVGVIWHRQYALKRLGGLRV